MVRKLLFPLVCVLIIAGCSGSDNFDMSDPLSTARGFIEASLNGDYVRAEKYMVSDSTNSQYLSNLQEFNRKLTPLERDNYRTADIIIDSTRMLNDSTDIVYYRNSYKMEPTKLRLIRQEDKWKIDFKYTFEDE